MEHTQMLSVGIDIGTSTSQVIFSRLTVENTAGYFCVTLKINPLLCRGRAVL